MGLLFVGAFYALLHGLAHFLREVDPDQDGHDDHHWQQRGQPRPRDQRQRRQQPQQQQAGPGRYCLQTSSSAY